MDNYYQTLDVPPTATRSEIKLAYHTLLLKHHPDKKIIPENNSSSLSSSPVDISLLKEAYTTLSSPLSRSQYDTSLKNFLPLPTAAKLNPRPAQIISLEDFTQSQSQEADAWDYPCRCGGTYRISESDMDKGQHLVGCRGCSEVIWVGYELVDGEGSSSSS